MKKMVYAAALLAVIVFAVSCATPGVATAVDTGAYGSQEAIDKAFEQVYTEYSGALILDGAAAYTVSKGDSLSRIASRNYGFANMYYFPIIMLASQDITSIKDPDQIEVGMKLRIPNLQRNLANAGARAKIKSYLGEIAVVYDNKDQSKAAQELRKEAGKL